MGPENTSLDKQFDENILQISYDLGSDLLNEHT